MNILLDTCTFLWIISEGRELSTTAKALFVDPDNSIYLSSASAWEISIKYALKKLPLPEPPKFFVPDQREKHAVESLPIDEASTLHLNQLPPLHRDPFDRILVCQAIEHSMIMLSPDTAISQYPIKCVW